MMISGGYLLVAQEGTSDSAQTDGVTKGPVIVEKPDPLKRPMSDKEKRDQQKALRQELKGVYKKWVDEDVRWIITDQELQAFRSLSNDEERDQFIENFWLRRNPNPDSPENEFREEHYARIAYAIKVLNEHGIVHSGDALTGGVGAMSDARWAGFYGSMTDVDVLPKGLDVRQAYTLDFVNKGIGRK